MWRRDVRTTMIRDPLCGVAVSAAHRTEQFEGKPEGEVRWEQTFQRSNVATSKRLSDTWPDAQPLGDLTPQFAEGLRGRL